MTSSALVLYAVIVGWNGSPSPDVPRLRFADDDAAEYARLFRNAGARVTLLTRLDEDSKTLHADAHPDGSPTREALTATLERIDREMALGEQRGERGELYIVYSGHGDVDHGEGYVTLDGGRLTRSDLHEHVLSGRRADRIHLIVDACKSYFFVYARGGGRRPHNAAFVDERLPESLPRVGFLLSTSTDNESHEWEDFQGGIFSHEVRSALRGAADANEDGQVSYAELGAFVRRANASVPNPRFRPRFTVAPPRGSSLGDGTPVLRWPAVDPVSRAGDGRARTPAPSAERAIATERAVVLDAPDLGRISVEDSVGRRIVDANLSDARATLHLPTDEPLFIWSRARDREYALPASLETVRLSTVQPAPRRIASRGALHEALGRIFALPFDVAAVTDYRAYPDAPLVEDAAPATSLRARLTRATLGIAIASAAAAVAGTVAAAVVRSDAASADQRSRVTANDRIGLLNAGAIGLYSVAGAAAVTCALLAFLPPQKPSAPVAITATPGPGDVGLSLAAAWR